MEIILVTLWHILKMFLEALSYLLLGLGAWMVWEQLKESIAKQVVDKTKEGR
jgi:ABC-type nickel/cobalt efflux system permease component RcnA